MGYSIGSAVDVRMSKYVEGGVRWSPSARPMLSAGEFQPVCPDMQE